LSSPRKRDPWQANGKQGEKPGENGNHTARPGLVYAFRGNDDNVERGLAPMAKRIKCPTDSFKNSYYTDGWFSAGGGLTKFHMSFFRSSGPGRMFVSAFRAGIHFPRFLQEQEGILVRICFLFSVLLN
jgi:hypothetical protein